jgi:hypothetical protein
MTPHLGEADLVHVAAVATGTSPQQVLADCDVAGLVSVVAAVEGAAGGLDAAALVVREVGRRRPFAAGNAVTAWLAAAHLLAADGLRLRIGHRAATTVFEAGAELSARDMAGVIAAHSERRLPVGRRALRWLVRPAPLAGPAVFRCPACDRPLVRRRHDLVAAGVWADAARVERMARCAVEYGSHDRYGRSHPGHRPQPSQLGPPGHPGHGPHRAEAVTA